MRYFLNISYDGTSFHGWQRQPNSMSIQEKLEDALSIVLRKEINIVGAGRTDTGVHATDMYAHFDHEFISDKEKLIKSLNNLCGNEICVNYIVRVTDSAHARFDALSRTYQYYISVKKNPFDFRYSHRLSRIPDLDLMNEAGEILLATEDFSSFAKLHSDNKTNICNVSFARWRDESDHIVFKIQADRFLRNMVRSIVGTLIDVGTRKITIEDFKEIIDRRDRCAAGTSMPAKGLFLTEVKYPKNIFLKNECKRQNTIPER